MAKKENAQKEEVQHSNRNLVNASNGVLQVVSVSHGRFKKMTGKMESVSDVGRIANYVNACFKKKEYNPKCAKCQDVGHFSVVGQTPNGEYTFAVICECTPASKDIMHSAEYEKMTRTVLTNKKETV